MATENTLKIKVEGTENVEKLVDTLDKVDVKVKEMPISAKELANTYKNNFQEVTEHVVLQIAKIEAILTELGTHVSQVINKNIEEGERLAQSIEHSGEGILASVKSKVDELPVVMEGYARMMTNMGDISATQSGILEGQLQKNKELIEGITDETFASLKTKYAEKGKEIGDLNLKAHKENVTAHIGELNKLKGELENSVAYTRAQYDAVFLSYSKDSEEFKKAQEEKAQELEKLQAKITEVNKQLKEQNSDYLIVWKQQHKEISTTLTGLSDEQGNGKIKEFIDKYSYGFKGFSDDLKNSIVTLNSEIDKTAEKEEELLNKKYESKIGKLDKELEKVNAEVTKYEKEKEQLKKEQTEASAKAEKYKADIAKIKDTFDIKESKPSTGDGEALSEPTDSSDMSLLSSTDEVPASEGAEDKNKISPPSDEEMQAARARISELEELAAAEKSIVNGKQEKIAEADKNITESNRSVLLEQMRIADEKAKLEAEKEKKEAEIEKKKQKRKEQIEKLEKLRAKAQAVYDIADATKNIAKGVALAWGKGPILGPPLAALVAIQGAIQLGVMTQQLKYLKDGGLLNGKRHSQGGMRIEGTNIEVEGGEYVVNRESTSKNLGLVRYINSQRKEITPTDINGFFSKASQGYEPPFRRMFETGGQMPVVSSSNTVDNEALVDAIKSIKIAPKVAVTDILRVQDEMVQVDSWSGN